MPTTRLYNVLLTLLAPLIYLWMWRRRARGKEPGAAWGERWGHLPDAVARDLRTPRLWVHAVSVGEVMAAAPLLRELRTCYPDALLVLSTTTAGGREVAQRQIPPADFVVAFPIDFAHVVRRSLAAIKPDALILMEWEIWPNLLTRAKASGAKIIVVNGRISDRGLRRGERWGWLTRAGIAAVDIFAMQSDEDARRAILVGARAERVQVVGNTKFDESVQMVTDEERVAIRAELGIPPNAPVWVCGSTRPGEEAIIAQAFRQVRATLPDLHLIVAPRHIERAGEVMEIFADAGITLSQRSTDKQFGDRQALVLDTFGELARVYAVAQIAFVGGSLLPFGGQSIFQPLAQGVPVLFGPHMNNQRDIAALAKLNDIGQEVTDAATLAQAVGEALGRNPAAQAALAARCRALIERNQGVAARCVEIIGRLLAFAKGEV